MKSSLKSRGFSRRNFLKTGLFGTGIMLGQPGLFAGDEKQQGRIATNIDDIVKIPRTDNSLPGRFPGRVVEVSNPGAMTEEKVDPVIIQDMFDTGLTKLTGKSRMESFGLFFSENDVIGIKVNPVGAGLISTRLEVVDVVIEWLTGNGIPRHNIVIWDRFDYMLADAGFTQERYPRVRIEGLQTMDESAASGESDDNSHWLDKNGKHVSLDKFDKDVFYFADVEGPKEDAYLNQHVVNGKYSYFGNLLTKSIDKIINIPVFKNTGNGISIATKNIGYGALCNTGRLHKPLFFDVCTEVLAFPVIRDKLVLNITDGLRGQYDGGPGPNAQFTYLLNKLYFATDPFALDMICHNQIVKKRIEMDVKVNEHPKYSEYLRYAERLGLGIVSDEKLKHIKA